MKEAFGYECYDKEVNHRTLLFQYLFLSYCCFDDVGNFEKVIIFPVHPESFRKIQQ